MQGFRVVYRGISHELESLILSWYTPEPLGECVYQENVSDEWDIPWYTMRKGCINILYLTIRLLALVFYEQIVNEAQPR